jgi:UDP-glucose 4-epimerase
LKKSTVLVTGSAGFMGSHLVDALLKSGHRVYGVDNLSIGYLENVTPLARKTFTKLDLRNRIQIADLIRKIRPDVIYHLAAIAREGLSQFTPISHTENNYNVYLNVLVPAIKNKVRRIVLFSSMAVYGDQKPPFTEDMFRKPVDIYGTAKAAMEQATEALSDVFGFEYVILRPHNVYGPRQNLADPYRNVIAIFINRLLQKKPFYIYGNGEQTRSFTYIGDIVEPMLKAGFGEKISGQIINLGPERSYTINQMARIVLDSFGSDLHPIYFPDRPREVKDAFCSSAKAKKLLGFSDQIPLSKGVNEMVIWAKSIGFKRPQYLRFLEIDEGKVPKTWTDKLI